MGGGIARLTCLVGLAALLCAAQPAPSPRLVQVRVGEHPGFSRVVLELDRQVGYRIDRSGGQAGELVITLDASSVARRIRSRSSMVSGVSVERGVGRTRVQVSLRREAPRLKELILSNPPRIVIDVVQPQRAAAASTRKQPPRAPATAEKRAPGAAQTPQPATTVAKVEETVEPAAPREPAPEVAEPTAPKVAERAAPAAESVEAARGPISEPAAEPGDQPATEPERAEIAASRPAAGDLQQEVGADTAGRAAPAPAAGRVVEPGAIPGRRPATPREPAGVPARVSDRSRAEAPEGRFAWPPAWPPGDRSEWLTLVGLAGVAVVLLAAAALVALRFGQGRRRRKLLDAEPGGAEPGWAESVGFGAELQQSAGEDEEVSGFGGFGPYAGDSEKEERGMDAEVGVSADLPVQPAGFGGDADVAHLVHQLERRVAQLEARIDESNESRERLERQVAAQSEELRVQRAAIARTQRALRSMARGADDRTTTPGIRGPSQAGGS